MPGLIDWDLLAALDMPPAMSQPAMWDAFADRYNGYAALQDECSRLQVQALGLRPQDTVLDVGAGPGRLSIPAAKLARAVTALDVSRPMLDHLQRNAAAAGLCNVSTLHLPWDRVVPGETVPVHDVVIASRSPAMRDLDTLDALARRAVYVLLFCGPSLKAFHDTLVAGIEPAPPAAREAVRRPAIAGHALVFNRLVDRGIEAQVSYLPDGFGGSFADWDELERRFAWLRIGPEHRARFRDNIGPYVSEEGGRLRLRLRSRTAMVWWTK